MADRTAAAKISSELVFRRGTPPATTYFFKHALVQDTAYDTLLKSRRQQLHAHIVQALEEQFPETAETQPELLAHHCAQAGKPERAIGYWRAAAQRASERSAHHEAVAHLRKGLELLSQLSESEARDRLELQLQISLGSVLVVIHGYSALPAEESMSERASWRMSSMIRHSCLRPLGASG